ncbi:hypothetical protein As57867_014156, partial [Aphanomyces stellatus]
AIVVVTAHWETIPEVTISSGESHDLLYDYYGFPSDAYSISYKAKGSPAVAQKIHDLLSQASIPSKLDATRGWDHGTFVPMKLINPEEDIPVVQMSVVGSWDPAHHLRIGQVLAALRDENIAILGSGMSYHPTGFRLVMDNAKPFGEALVAACAKTDAAARGQALTKWESFPKARKCHQREEHLVPLFVVAGAGGDGNVETVDVYDNGVFKAFGWGV